MTATAEAPVPRLSLRLVTLLAACTAVGPAALNVYLPSLPAVQDEFHASLADVQSTVSIPLVAFGLALVLLGPLSDRFGRRPTLLGGLLAFTLGSLVAWLAPGLIWLGAGRSLQSAGAAMAFISSRSVIADVTPREQLKRSVAQMTMIMLVSQMVAPTLGNFALVAGGWRAIQLSVLVIGAVLCVLTAFALRETIAPAVRAAHAGFGALVRPTWRLLTRGRFVLLMLQSGLFYAAFPALISTAPHLMVEAFGRPATEYGYYFAVLPLGYFLGNAFVLRYGSRFSERQLVAGGALLGVVSALLTVVLLALGAWHPLSLFLPAGTLLNIGLGLALPALSARGVEAAHPNTGSGWGLVGFGQQVVAALAVQALGFLPSDTPYPVAWTCVALAAAGGLIELSRRSYPHARG